MSTDSRAAATEGPAIKLGRFTLERRLGEGSMGAVYLAFDAIRGERVALKTLRRVDASGIYRFKREFRALADVSHPNLVALYELFSEGSDWCFTMEYVEGQDFLSHAIGHCAQRPAEISGKHTRQLRASAARHAPGMEVLFPTPLGNAERLRDVLRQVTEAVIALHAAGKLHRDLKPDNVMVTGEGRAVVLDFGIAAELGPDSQGTLEAGVVGTPAYMSPEQAAGRAVTEATDWYALGAMLYEALTGQVPFDGPYREVIEQKQRVDPPAPSQLVSGVPEELEQLCLRLLARDPESRPSGREILQALGSASLDAKAPAAQDAGPPFVGRAQELAELSRALHATSAGAPVVVLVHGNTGMGKTALIERFLEGAGEGRMVALSGRCYEHEVVPFKALDSLVDALSGYLGRLSDTEAAEVVPKDVHALAQLFPVLRRVDVVRTARRRAGVAPDPRTLRHQATQALKELLFRIAMREPLVAFIDDLHWGDVDSARLLGELLSGAERPAMLLVCTYRSADRERSACLSTLLALLRDRSQVQVREVEVGALSGRESEALANQLLKDGSEAETTALARESRGSPYLLAQLVEHVRSERSTASSEIDSTIGITLEGALAQRLETLSPEATSVLELVAVSGRPLREQVMAKLAPGEHGLGPVLLELRRAKLVRGVGGPDARAVGIYHDSIREAVLSRMHPPEVAGLHRRLAVAIENSEPLDLEALIDHLIGAGDPARAGIYAISAAHQAIEALAFDKAAELFEVALRHHHDDAWRRELLAHWAEALVSAGRSTRAAEVYLRAAEGAPTDDAWDLRRKAGVHLMLSGRWDHSVEVLSPALAHLGIDFPRNGVDAVTASIQLRAVLQKRGVGFVRRAERDLPAAVRQRLDALWSVVQATFAADPIICQVFVVRHLLDALEAGEQTRIVVGLCAYFIIVDFSYSSFGGVKPRSLQQAEVLQRDLDDPRCEAWVELARAYAFQSEGLLKPAGEHFARAEDLFRNHCRDVAPELNACRILTARTLVHLNQLEELAVCERWIREAAECEDALTVAKLRMICVPRALMLDDVEQAERALELPPGLPNDRLGLTRLLLLSSRLHVALYRGDAVLQHSVADKMDDAARSPLLGVRVWRSEHLISRARARLAASKNAPDPEPLLTRAEQAIVKLEALALECHADHVRLLRASLAHRRGRNDEAVALLDTILADADMGGESSLIRVCARLCKGRLLGTEGEPLVRQAQDELASRGVKNPQRFARIYAPGFDESGSA
jgi:tRNA A-37 threonylcarbamoyl transferase component Bud32/tetratricopeptide (TPR) repeat protein